MNGLRRFWCRLRGYHDWSSIKRHASLGRFVECRFCGHIITETRI